MSLPQSTEDHASTPSVREKDRWWLENVYRGGASQLTARVVVSGFLIGGLLAVMNLYIGARIGASLGTSITAVVLGYLIFGALHRVGAARRIGVLEGVMLQSIACSAGYMCSPLTASMSAYMAVTGVVVPWWQMILWLLGLSVLGVAFAIPFKRRFINKEQAPFPEGRACGVVLEVLHDRGTPRAVDPSTGGNVDASGPARLLVFFGVCAGMIKLLQSPAILSKLKLGFLAIPEMLDGWYYRLSAARGLWLPAIGGIPLRELTIRPSFDIAMMALGGLMGMRICGSLLAGAVVNYCVLAPWMVHRGDIHSAVGADGGMIVGFRAITTWSLWCGAAIMTSASLWSFVSGWRTSLAIFSARKMAGGGPAEDPLRSIELPNAWFLAAGIPASLVMVWMAWNFFDVKPWLGLAAMPLVLLMTLIAVNVTALTSMTPHGALGKITQLTYGALAPGNVTTNIVAAGLSAEVALQASNFIQNLKPGYMLGARPRLQAAGHLIGAVSGACFGVAVFYPVFLKSNPSTLMSEEYPFPAVVVWKAVAEALTGGLGALPYSAIIAALSGAVAGLVLEAMRQKFGERFPVSPMSMGLAFVIPFQVSLAMFAGALVFCACGWLHPRPEGRLHRVVVQNRETTCAGVVAGAALVGVAAAAVEVL